MQGWLYPETMTLAEAQKRGRAVDMHSEVFRRVAPAEVRPVRGRRPAHAARRRRREGRHRECLRAARRVRCIRAPWHARSRRRWRETADGVLIGNGPGDPKDLDALIEQVRGLFGTFSGPIFGVCLGQPDPRAARRAVEPTSCRYGHRGVNQPVQELGTGRCYVTSQNHGYAVDDERRCRRLGALVREHQRRHQRGHPVADAADLQRAVPPRRPAGPADTEFLFDDFLRVGRRRCATARTACSCRSHARPRARLRRAADRPGGRVRLLRIAGDQGAARRRASRTVLVNPNIATIQTSEELADRVYLVAVTPDFVERDHRQGRASTRSCSSFGGQTALNCGLALDDARRAREARRARPRHADRAIRDTEDRELFVERLSEIGVKTARSKACASRRGRARRRRDDRPAGDAARRLRARRQGQRHRRDARPSSRRRSSARSPAARRRCWSRSACAAGRRSSTRSCATRRDNCITVCNMENFDPMGIHTGESIVVAPSQTLDDDGVPAAPHDRDQDRRATSGIVGECNIQYALDPTSLRLPRDRGQRAAVALVSALASKATGYPLAYVAAKLGARPHAARDSRTASRAGRPRSSSRRSTTSSASSRAGTSTKFRGGRRSIGSEMKSVGEVMAIGRTFPEVLQKALRMLDIGVRRPRSATRSRSPTSTRAAVRRRRAALFAIAQALQRRHERRGDPRADADRSAGSCARSRRSCDMHDAARAAARRLDAATLREAKQLGFSDSMHRRADEVAARHDAGGATCGTASGPHLAQIDTLAAEFPADTNYLYSTYHADASDATPSQPEEGAGPRLGRLPHRLERRVRLVLRQRRAGRRGARLRDHHAQLQPRDGQHRLRHLRPARLRRDQPRVGARALRARAAGRRGRQHGRADSRTTSRCGCTQAGVPILGTTAREHRPRRGPLASSAPCSTSSASTSRAGRTLTDVTDAERSRRAASAASRCSCARATC